MAVYVSIGGKIALLKCMAAKLIIKKYRFSGEHINICMKLQEIREKLGYTNLTKKDCKQAVREWLVGKSADYPIALTLTLKQTLTEQTPFAIRKRSLTKKDAVKLAERFTQKLNREVFGRRGADKKDKSLKYVCVLEGERSNKNLHLHFAIGGLPKSIKLNQFPAIVVAAKSNVEHIDTQHDVQIADSGWMNYILKEVSYKHTDSVLWELFK